jgi:hypothetical protein
MFYYSTFYLLGGDSELSVRGIAGLPILVFGAGGDGELVGKRLLAFTGEGKELGLTVVLLAESDVTGGTVTFILVLRGGFFLRSMMIIVMPPSAATSIKMIAKGVILKYRRFPCRS